jgi:hypothetical protein
MENEVEFNWAVLGARLVSLNDNEQAEFFKGFAIELASWDTHYQREMQMHYIGNKLSPKIKETLEKYLSTLWYKDEGETP